MDDILISEYCRPKNTRVRIYSTANVQRREKPVLRYELSVNDAVFKVQWSDRFLDYSDILFIVYWRVFFWTEEIPTALTRENWLCILSACFEDETGRVIHDQLKEQVEFDCVEYKNRHIRIRAKRRPASDNLSVISSYSLITCNCLDTVPKEEHNDYRLFAVTRISGVNEPPMTFKDAFDALIALGYDPDN